MNADLLKMLKPCPEAIQKSGSGNFAEFVQFINDQHIPSFANGGIALLGVSEIADQIRSGLFNLHFHGKSLNFYDLGNVLNDTYTLNILEYLFSKNIFTILLGNGVSDIYNALSKNNHQLSACFITPSSEKEEIRYLFEKRTENLFDLKIMGIQQYLCCPQTIGEFHDSYFQAVGLGDIRNDIKISEPLLRDTDMLTIDITSVRKADSCLVNAGPNGLYAEEICKLSSYAGFSDRLKAVSFTGFSDIENTCETPSILAAEVIWHLVEGYINRKNESLLNNVNGIKKILVNLDNPECRLVFYQSVISQRWWMEVESPTNSKPYIIACSERDYKEACNHELPVRWIWYRQKLSTNFKTY